MDWDFPTWWGFVVIVLAAYRVWRLIALDSVFDRPRNRVLRRVPEKLHEGVQCPFCLGFWVVVAIWLLWIAWPKWTLIIAAPFALNGALGLLYANADPAAKE